MLSKGSIAARGTPDEVIRAYVGDVRADVERSIRDRENRIGDGRMRFTDVHFERDGAEVDTCTTSEDCEIVLSYETADGRPIRGANFWLSIVTLNDSNPLIYLSSETSGAEFHELPPRGEVRCYLPRCPLPADQYLLHMGVEVNRQVADWVQNASEFTVAGGDFYGTGREPGEKHPTVLVDQAWSLSPVSEAAGNAAPARDGRETKPERVG
jgi:lipopolysaccharide transport system ATP-binding protein